ncbi:MAG TPA: hypothetical protein DEH78_05390, partial [Solibacterales bacterium]|nr:hypothetical protein [Bryobacterales bacterium]
MQAESLLHYHLIEKLGEGGMGVVWRAHDTRLERDVALKILPPDPAGDPVRKQRFAREARSASALSHPNIITVFEINEDRGVPFIAMEYVRGHTLAHILRSGALSVERAVPYALEIAAALDHAHKAGIVHRDLKPGNVMITPEDRVKVLDFGLAKHYRASESTLAAEATVTVQLTEAGTTMGTVAYMSPEQSVGDPVDHRSDIFSFGAVFYQMLTGALPFQATTQAGLLRAIHLEEPRPVADLRPGAPPLCDKIIAKAMEKKPEDRYQSMAELVRDLRQVLPGLPTTGELRFAETHDTATVAVPVRPAPRRRPWLWPAVAILAVSVAGFGAYLYRSRNAPPPASKDAPLTGTPQELYAEALRLLDRYDQPGNVDSATRRLEAVLQKEPSNAGAHAALARAYYHRNGLSPDPQWLRLATESAKRAVELNGDLAAGHLATAIAANETGKREQALAAIARALDLDPANSIAHMWAGHIHLAMGKKPEALAAYQKAVALAPGDWPGLMALGVYHYRLGNYEQA